MIELEVTSNNSYIDLHFHYFLDNENTHSMDAEVFNTCERQLIQVIKDQHKYFDEKVKIEIFAKKTGSIIDTLRVISEDYYNSKCNYLCIDSIFYGKICFKKRYFRRHKE